MSDNFGDRMKLYEMAEAGRCLMPLLPIIARIDGRCFSRFTRDLERPYDKRLSDLMVETMRVVTIETGAVCAYTQSDEISLAWHVDAFESQTIFNGRIQKLNSVLASMASAVFAHNLPAFPPSEMAARIPHFDCRVWNVPNLDEATNAFLWRELDASKNSISMAARELYSHKQLFERSGSEMQEMMFQKGINWNGYPDFFKRGTFCIRRVVVRAFTTDELTKLPEKHAARQDPDLQIERQEYFTAPLPRLLTISNRVGVLFRGEQPVET